MDKVLVTKELLNPNNLQHLEEIATFLDSYNIPYTRPEINVFKFTFDDPSKKGYEIHYIPSHLFGQAMPNMNIPGISKDYFYKLSEEADSRNVFNCWTKDFEWADERKQGVLKSYWLYAAGKIEKTFYARDTEVREVPTKQAREFESQHCFYGKRGASLNLGLYLKKDKHGFKKGTLIMLYTFGLNYFGKNGAIEVLRVGTYKECNVVGGASKLLKYFLDHYETLTMGGKEVPVTHIVFYSDRDHNSGHSMAGIGWEYRNSSVGGFMNFWVDENKAKHREPSKHKWVMEQMRLGKVISIPGAGVNTYDMYIDRELHPIKPKPELEPLVVPQVSVVSGPKLF